MKRKITRELFSFHGYKDIDVYLRIKIESLFNRILESHKEAVNACLKELWRHIEFRPYLDLAFKEHFGGLVE